MNATTDTAKVPTNKKRKFNKAKDARGRDIRGLWERNGRFYLQMRANGKQSKIPLVDANGAPYTTVPQARAAAAELTQQRTDNTLPVLVKTPSLGEWIDSYLDWATRAEAKSPLTIAKERCDLSKWKGKFGDVRLSRLTRADVHAFIAWRREQTPGLSNRTINLDIIALNNCLNHAVEEGIIKTLPTDTWKPFEHVSPKRPTRTQAQVDSICTMAIARGGNGELLADFIQLMVYSGARRSEALAIRWEDIDWNQRILHLRGKYGQGQFTRGVDFNAKLEAHLKSMGAKKQSEWLFPNPNKPSEHAGDLQPLLALVRQAAGVPDFQFHDCRHFFISECVMAGVDFLTLARWVGHKDGGVLIGKVYGHLRNDHVKKQATRVFAAEAPAPVEPKKPEIDVQTLLAQVQQQNELIAKLLAQKAA